LCGSRKRLMGPTTYSAMNDLILDERLSYVDSKWWSPSERATGVHNLIIDLRKHLKEVEKLPSSEIPSDLDILCFAVEYLGLQAVAIGDPILLDLAAQVSKWLYSVHYTTPELLYGAPDRKAI